MLKADIDKDLKTAMLSGDKSLVETLRGLKSAILYKEVADNKRDIGLSDVEIIVVLKKEQKSRRDASELYEKAGEQSRLDHEQYQIGVIKKYLPEEMSEEQVVRTVNAVMEDLEISSPTQADMGRLIGMVKKAAPTADGSVIAKIVKEKIKKR